MEIAVAAYGWQGGEWDDFYPDDLPLEWRLDYYANEFFSVLVPHAEWSVLDDEALLYWQEEVSDDFTFFWELPAGEEAGVARLQSLLANEAFGAHWGGVVDLSLDSPCAQRPFVDGALAMLRLTENLELRPLREAMEGAMAGGTSRLLVVVEAAAAGSLRPARDLAQMLA
jgi:hypothetical protein